MISVIILNYNRREDVLFTLSNILSSNKGYNNFEIILVDQNSSDGSQLAIKEMFPMVNLYCSEINLGVAGGRNMGAKLAKGAVLVFIDDDAHFKTKTALKVVEENFKKDISLGIIGFKILDVNNKLRDWVYNKASEKLENIAFYSQQYVGCGHAIRTDLFNQMGGYSESLFFWGEEIEFCLKTYRDTTFTIIYQPKIEVIHRVSPLSRYHWRTSRTEFKTRNRFILLYSYFPRVSVYFYVFYVYFFIGYLFRSIQNISFKYFFKGFKDALFIRLPQKKLKRKQIAAYSKCYFKQFVGMPELYEH